MARHGRCPLVTPGTAGVGAAAGGSSWHCHPVPLSPHSPCPGRVTTPVSPEPPPCPVSPACPRRQDMDSMFEDDISILTQEALGPDEDWLDSPNTDLSGEMCSASHLALITAYDDIKNRLTGLERENSTLKRRLKMYEVKYPLIGRVRRGAHLLPLRGQGELAAQEREGVAAAAAQPVPARAAEEQRAGGAAGGDDPGLREAVRGEGGPGD
uniref:Uncharacterized protein n=1 Tax=Geospiza parvula TaxID=87175 RepID=A0A8C3N4D8_GEOPR